MSPSYVISTILLLMALGAVLTIAALVSVMRTPALDQTNRIIWVVVVLMLPVIGAIAWFIARPKNPTNTPSNKHFTH
ncbi:PLD nuclease N-terminal domain-containing protein [Jonesia quinghaiensis]|uniref:PLD nuclease N-terminal domain-containing protein n=1 Tax=Jonesia quinghaiensis TaxID=262806 RepID=UPI000403A662|nr:PLD nuclease N-terminal domain-containing protein [Jonesia quinghaiensis]